MNKVVSPEKKSNEAFKSEQLLVQRISDQKKCEATKNIFRKYAEHYFSGRQSPLRLTFESSDFIFRVSRPTRNSQFSSL